MPRYVIERQYLVPIYEHILVEAASLETACREALDEDAQPWGDNSKLDYEDARLTTVSAAVELPETTCPELRAGEDADDHDLSLLLYNSGLELLPIPSEDTGVGETQEGIGFS